MTYFIATYWLLSTWYLMDELHRRYKSADDKPMYWMLVVAALLFGWILSPIGFLEKKGIL